jgi:cytochrome c556
LYSEAENTLEFPGATKTLRARLNEGRLTVQDGLRYAALLAEALRAMHDDGRAHGSITPDSIALKAAGIDLLPAAGHKPVDARSDIFSFGAVVFEMLTGRQPFDAETESSRAASLCSPAVDQFLAGCLAEDPAARWPIQKVQLELKLLTGAARRGSAPGAAPRAVTVSQAPFRAEMAQFEARMDAIEVAAGCIQAQMQRSIDILSERVNELEHNQIAPAVEFARHQTGMENLREQIGELQTHVTADMHEFELNLHEFELNLKTQSSAIDSARTAVSQTDDLVERVVEALESLQSTVLEAV